MASNLRGGGRNSSDGLVHVRLRQLQAQSNGSSKPTVLAEATKDLRSGEVTLVSPATGRTKN